MQKVWKKIIPGFEKEVIKMSFIIYDIMLLVLFAIFISIFLYRGKKNLKKEGLLLLYKTSWGIKLINYVGKNFKKSLKFLSYVGICVGYFLMAGVIYLFWILIRTYVSRPDIVTAIKIPPIMPLIPYLPQLFSLDFLPPFYFTYWIVILAVVAITHEFAHGIFAAYNKIKIKRTGFGFFPFFLPVFLAAFVELDEKIMKKKTKFAQMAVLAAGTFANVLTAILFFGVMWLFFSLAFAPAGVVFDSYPYSAVSVAGITMVNNIQLDNPSVEGILDLMNEEGFNEIKTEEGNYLATKSLLEEQEGDVIVLFDSAPAIKADLEGVITEINGVEVKNIDELGEEVSKYSVGDEIVIKTKIKDSYSEYELILEKGPTGSPWIGIGFIPMDDSRLIGKIVKIISSFKEEHVYYEPIFNAAEFIYNLLWWLVLICISVALINMLPVGIFDGGRFFYLTVLGITRSEKKAKKAFKFVTWFFLLFLLVLMFFWALSWVL